MKWVNATERAIDPNGPLFIFPSYYFFVVEPLFTHVNDVEKKKENVIASHFEMSRTARKTSNKTIMVE